MTSISNKNRQEAYRSFAAGLPDLPLFLQPWYLDAVCEGGKWDAALVERGGRPVAALPYFQKQKFGWKYVTMPPLCKQLGPFLLPQYRTLKWEMRLYPELISALQTDLAAFEQNFNYSVVNWMPFYWSGFKQTTLYSYVIDLTQAEDSIFKNIEKNYRQKIRAAEAKLSIRDDLPLSELHRLLGLSFRRQNLEAPIGFDFLERLHKALSARGGCKLFFATDPVTGHVHSAALLAWDGHTAYYLMSGDDPALRSSGAAVLLKWTAIVYAKNTLGVSQFDFEGSMLKAIEQGRRDFGATQRPYFRVRREWSVWWRIGKGLRGWR